MEISDICTTINFNQHAVCPGLDFVTWLFAIYNHNMPRARDDNSRVSRNSRNTKRQALTSLKISVTKGMIDVYGIANGK